MTFGNEFRTLQSRESLAVSSLHARSRARPPRPAPAQTLHPAARAGRISAGPADLQLALQKPLLRSPATAAVVVAATVAVVVAATVAVVVAATVAVVEAETVAVVEAETVAVVEAETVTAVEAGAMTAYPRDSDV